MAIDNSLAAGLRKRYLREMDDVERRIRSGVQGVRKTRPAAFLKGARLVIEHIRTPWVLDISVRGKKRHTTLNILYVGHDRISGGDGGIGINHLVINPASRNASAGQFFLYCTAHAFERVIQASAMEEGKIGVWTSNVLSMAAGAAMRAFETKSMPEGFRLFAVDDQEPPSIKALVIMRLDEELAQRLHANVPVYGIRTVIPGGDRMDPRYEREFRHAEMLPTNYWIEEIAA